MDSIKYFNRWFVNPINKLKDLPDGDGGFAAFMIAIPLYERYIKGKLKLAGECADKKSVKKEISKDLRMNDDERKIFWDMFRNGFMHQGMPKKGKTKYMFSSSFSAIPEVKEINSKNFICLDPWKFSERVLNKFLEEPKLITVSESCPLASIFVMPNDIKNEDFSTASGDAPF